MTAGWLARIRSGPGTPWIRTVAALALAQTVSEMAFSLALPFTPLYVQQLGVPDVTQAALWAGVMAGVFSVAMGGMAPIWGAAGDRFGYRLMIQRATFGAGLAIGAMSPLIQAVLVDAVPAGRRGAAFGWLTTANAVGNGGGPVVGSFVAAGFGVPAVFVATTPVFAVGGWLLARTRPKHAG